MAQTKAEILKALKSEKVRFLRLQITDILGVVKNVEVPESQFEKALDGEIMFDGSSIEGFTRIEESDMLLKPDYNTFVILPDGVEDPARGRVARLICDVTYPDGRPFEGDPRYVLKRQIERLKKLGFDNMYAGPEPEFFLFLRTPEGLPTVETHDKAGYFDLAPIDKGEEARRDVVNVLVAMGFEIEASHHEVAPGQHEIDFKYADALTTADNIATFKWVVKRVALNHGLHATFMPKPIRGINGSGMHTHQSLWKNGTPLFYDEKGYAELSRLALHYVAGLLAHGPALAALTNPTVNSYRRLVPGYEAPVNLILSKRNRSAVVRVPMYQVGPEAAKSKRIEYRAPDPSSNPYLALAVMAAAAIDGIERKLLPPPPIQRNIYQMSVREKRKHKIRELPGTLREALEALKKDPVIREALGEHVYTHFLQAKQMEWDDYRITVHQWELDQYLATY